MSKILKASICIAIALGLFATYIAEDPAKIEPAEKPPVVVTEAVPTVTSPKPVPVVQKPRMSEQAKEAQARRGEEIESRPVNHGDRGMPATDSVSKKVVRSKSK